MNKITVPEKYLKERIDIIISENIADLTRSSLKNRLNFVKLNGKPCKTSSKAKSGDIIEFDIVSTVENSFSAENIPLNIIYQDKNVFVINKPQGMVVHPAAGNYSGTMAQGIKFLLNKEDSDFLNNDTRPGIVHRLDKDTSGIIIAAKNTKSLEELSAQFKNRSASKTYLAIIKGRLPLKSGTIKTLIARDKINRKKMTWQTKKGKEAVTNYKVLSEYENFSFVALYPKTGRTHQLRVHMLSMKTPILGDPLYTKKNTTEKLMLHAYKLQITLPGETKIRKFRAPLPERFKIQLCDFANNN